MPRRPCPWYRKSRRLWYVEINGHQHNLGPDKDEAFQRFHRLMVEPQRRLTEGESLVALIDVFLEWTQKHRAAATYAWYQHLLQRFAKRWPDLLITHLRPYHVQQWVDSYPNFSRTTQRNCIRAVKRCVKWTKQQGYIDKNPIEDLEVPGGESRDLVLTPEEYTRLHEYLRGEGFIDLVTTTWEIGCRPQEILRVEARHVDLKNSRWVFEAPEAKGKKRPRAIYLTDRALAVTKRLMLKHPEGRLFRNSAGRPWATYAVSCAFDRVQIRMGLKIMKEQGILIDHANVESMIPQLNPMKKTRGKHRLKTAQELREEARTKLRYRQAKKLAPHYSLYVLRHSWATNALQKGIDPLTTAILMGHRDPSTLSKVYQHLFLLPDHLREQLLKTVN